VHAAWRLISRKSEARQKTFISEETRAPRIVNPGVEAHIGAAKRSRQEKRTVPRPAVYMRRQDEAANFQI